MGCPLSSATFGEDRRVPLVMLHGFPLDGRMWEYQQEAAARHLMLVPDLRGFGRSPLPPKGFTLEDHARDVADCMDVHMIPRSVVCGFSMGGYVALALAAMFPRKIMGLVLVDTRAAADSEQGRQARTANAERALSEGMTFLADDMLFKLLAESTLRDDAALSRKVWSLMVDQRREGMAAALLAMRDRPSRADAVRGLECPVLVVVGEHDRLTPPAEAEAMAAGIPGTSVAIVPGAGHLTPMERPAAFNALLRDFLAGIPAS